LRKGIAVAAIAKNEGKFIAEWAAFHLSIGCDRIIVYVNDSEDDTETILRTLGRHYPVECVPWPSGDFRSPQRAAYADAIESTRDCEWIAFIDIDEFLVPWKDGSIGAFLDRVPEDVSAIGINWRMFGSSGQKSADYESVLHTFRDCSRPDFDFNNHVKTIARIEALTDMFIHHAVVRYGRMVNSSFAPLVLPTTGRMTKAVYAGIHVAHYQCKTLDEFLARRAKGNANFNPRHTKHLRAANEKGFRYVDRNEKRDIRLDAFLPAFDKTFAEVKAVLTEAGVYPRPAPPSA
jgi:glycosyltransferase involved in cell wall biosynthesis